MAPRGIHSHEHDVIHSLAARTGTSPEDWHLVFKARYGLELVYRALARTKGPGSVATQAYTCLTSVTPILAAGHEPVYLDVDEDVLAVGADAVGSLDRAPLAVVDQHTMGIIDDARSQALAAAAHRLGALLVEDGAHAVGRMARDGDGAPVADVCVYSFGVEKVLPTSHFGGAVWVSPAMADVATRGELVASLEALRPIGPSLERACRAYFNQSRVLAHLPAAMARRVGDGWVAKGRREPAVAADEVEGRLPLEPMAPGEWVSGEVAADLADLDANFRRRIETVAAFREVLSEDDALFVPGAVLARDQPLLRYPVFARDTGTALRIRDGVGRMGYYCVAWYRPLLFPGADAVAYHAPAAGALPVSEALSAGAVSLPADIGAEAAHAVAATCLALAHGEEAPA